MREQYRIQIRLNKKWFSLQLEDISINSDKELRVLTNDFRTNNPENTYRGQVKILKKWHTIAEASWEIKGAKPMLFSK